MLFRSWLQSRRQWHAVKNIELLMHGCDIVELKLEWTRLFGANLHEPTLTHGNVNLNIKYGLKIWCNFPESALINSRFCAEINSGIFQGGAEFNRHPYRYSDHFNSFTQLNAVVGEFCLDYCCFFNTSWYCWYLRGQKRVFIVKKNPTNCSVFYWQCVVLKCFWQMTISCMQMLPTCIYETLF